MLNTDPIMDAALASAERKIVARFVELTTILRETASVEVLTNLIETGTVQQAIDFITRSTPLSGAAWISAYVGTAQDIANAVSREIGVPSFEFNQTTDRAIATMRAEIDRIGRNWLVNQNRVALLAANNAIREGLDARGIATRIRDSLGLTPRQQQSLDNLRAGLAGTPDSPGRAARLASRPRQPLSPLRVAQAVERQRKRLVKARAANLGSREAIRAIHEGAHSALTQAVDLGLVLGNEIRRKWRTVGDSKVRGSHRSMNGQLRAFTEDFVSGRGARLRYPTDPRAPIEEIAECRCTLAFQLG